MIHIFDELIDSDYQKLIKETLFSNTYPWFFIEDITNSDGSKQKRSAFTHLLVKERNQNSEYHNLFVKMIQYCCAQIGKTNVDVLAGRSFLQLPLNLKDRMVDTAHIDSIEKHFVMLYYVCDSDGDTILYQEKEKSDVYTIQKRISPKQGRVVLFDGSYYHTAEQPINNNRCIVNYNLV